MVVNAFEVRMKSQLEQRKLDRSYRTLDKPSKGCDFSSNDYLGLAHSVAQHEFVQTKYEDRILNETSLYLGSTGSRFFQGIQVCTWRSSDFWLKFITDRVH